MQTASICPLDGRYRHLTEDIRRVWGDSHLMRHRVYIELKWLEYFMNHIHPKGPLTDQQRRDIESLYEVTEENLARIAALERQTNHDVKAVEYYVKERLSALPSVSGLLEFVHILCTSEDINNLAYASMTKETICLALLPNMEKLTDELQSRAAKHAEAPLLARTHGQPASPTTFGKEIGVYAHRLKVHVKRIKNLEICGKFNGAVGNFNAHVVCFPETDWEETAEAFVKSLDLAYQPLSTQIECHDWVSELCDDLARFNTTLLGLCVDCWTYISRDLLVLKHLESEVGSSTMPHKINPIDFENAEGNLGLANAMLRFFSGKLPVSRLQRDLSDSTCLRSLGCALAYSLLGLKSCLRGLEKIDVNEAAARAELQRHWEVLTEPVQCQMRRDGHAEAYEQLKKFSRGRQVTAEGLREFISDTALSPTVKEKLKALTPETYVGLASQLAKRS